MMSRNSSSYVCQQSMPIFFFILKKIQANCIVCEIVFRKWFSQYFNCIKKSDLTFTTTWNQLNIISEFIAKTCIIVFLFK